MLEHAFIYFEKFNNNRHAQTCYQLMIYIKTLKEFQINISCDTFFSL